MNKLAIAGIAVALIGIGAAGALVASAALQNPTETASKAPKMTPEAERFMADHPLPKVFCVAAGEHKHIVHEHLNEALIAAHHTTKLCYEGKISGDPETAGYCMVSEIFDGHIKRGVDCVLTAMEQNARFDLWEEENEQSLRFLKRYVETQKLYADKQVHLDLQR